MSWRTMVLAAVSAAVCVGAAPADTAADRLRRFDAVHRTVAEHFYEPSYRGVDWNAVGRRYRARLPQVRNDEELRRLITAMLAELRVSHLHLATAAGSAAASASPALMTERISGAEVVVAVAPGSDAATAGVRPGDVVETPEAELNGPLGQPAAVRVQRCDGSRAVLRVRRESARWPPARPAIAWRTIEVAPGRRLGLLKIDRFDDGAAALIDQAMQDLGGTQALIVDLRDNSGGNTSALRLASYLTDGPVAAVALFSRPYLNRLGRAPTAADVAAAPRVQGVHTDAGVFEAVSRHNGGAVFWTEDLGARRYRGRVAVLIGPESGSAAEGLVAVLGTLPRVTLVGRPTAGAVLSGETFDLEDGWRLTVPVHGLWDGQGRDLGDRPVPPQRLVAHTRRDLCEGRDADLAAAREVLLPALTDGSN